MVFSCISGGCLLSTSSYLHDSIIIYFFQAFRICSTFDMFSCLFDVFLFYFYFFMFSSAVTFSTISVFDTLILLCFLFRAHDLLAIKLLPSPWWIMGFCCLSGTDNNMQPKSYLAL